MLRAAPGAGRPTRPVSTTAEENEMSMKIVVDYELCEGHGECVVAAPEVFDLDEAVKICPIAALQLEG
ncbi:ferredoxin [Actinomycetospora soli]|uniref:ferredoxin n=1 Tax=Actinomycetospora soli TaxID=2893887 RepID=UPI001E523BA1|nr:ferredoxin [Actinomycetospora soli]MCD2191509.1 ferredoxin [Actinomycetospora soli]